jgi:hypothetical protein
MPDLAERILAELSTSRAALDDDQLAARLGVARQATNQACRRLAGLGLIGRGAVAGGKIFNWSLGGAAAERPVAAPISPTPPAITSGRAFEEHAREVLSRAWGVPLASRSVTLRGGLHHSFGLVSGDGSFVGDAKWFKDIAVPSAKFSVIAEYVWLLQHVEHAQRRFLVFGHDRAVPERWLHRFGAMLDGVEFYFLDEKLTRLR